MQIKFSYRGHHVELRQFGSDRHAVPSEFYEGPLFLIRIDGSRQETVGSVPLALTLVMEHAKTLIDLKEHGNQLAYWKDQPPLDIPF